MKLYYAPGACSMAPHIVACEAGLTLELERVDIPNKKTASGADFWAINPKGYVPALDTGKGVLTEVAVLCQYLADQNPAAGLAPAAGSFERYQLQEALNFAATEMHKQIGALFNPAMTPEMKVVQGNVVARRLKALERLLDGKQYIMGEKFTAPDAYLYTVLRWTKPHKIDLAEFPNVQAYMARVAARPKVQEALQSEGLL
jgi:glutathione S-transferase